MCLITCSFPPEALDCFFSGLNQIATGCFGSLIVVLGLDPSLIPRLSCTSQEAGNEAT